MSGYRVVASLFVSPARLALARRYSRIEDAVADMGEGVVIAADGHVAAFHEKHERVVAMRGGKFEGMSSGIHQHRAEASPVAGCAACEDLFAQAASE